MNSTTTTIYRNEDDYFYAIIDRLKKQGALNHDSFIKEIPFFNFSAISKEAQVKELFHDISNQHNYQMLLSTISNFSKDPNSSKVISQQLGTLQMMNFAQIILYKVLPCPDPTCPNKPREIATHNQYKDHEYHCPFYHHERDRRRLVITPFLEDEFTYKANYFEEGKRNTEREKHSQNYFESMFHPLYYKMFRCKREYCNNSSLCPFFHNEEEKRHWDIVFSNFVRKDRITFVKDKKKYFEGNNNNAARGNRERRNNIRPTMDTTLTPMAYNAFNRNANYQRSQVSSMTSLDSSGSSESRGWDHWNNNRTALKIDSEEFSDEFRPFGYMNGTSLPIRNC
jgi:hypothetical protein